MPELAELDRQDRRLLAEWRARWEPVAEDTHRLRVPGGWLYKHQRTAIGMVQPPATLMFIPLDVVPWNPGTADGCDEANDD